MFADIGNVALYAGLGVSLFALFAFFNGIAGKDRKWVSTANTCVTLIAGLTTVAAAMLWYSLLSGDFSIKAVFEYTSADLAPVYKFSAFWASQAGSLLLWLWLNSIFATVVTNSVNTEDEKLRPYVSAILTVVSFIFFVIVALLANPFEKMPYAPSNGLGLNPLLQNFGMIIHPITLYLGYVGFAVPYAYAMAALIARDSKKVWLKASRPWTLIAWAFLSIGMIYGGQWAYVELGWGGYWAWDPVENASLFPWLTATALFHSALMHERKGLLKGWAQWLATATYALCVFGTFLTRSGILQSVHAFPSNPLMTATFLTLIILTIGVGVYLIVTRREQLAGETEIEDFTSKEGTFLLNNILLSFASFAVVLGTMMPVITKFFTKQQLSMDARFFNTFSIPLGILLLVLIGFCTRVAWKPSETRDSSETIWTSSLALAFGILLFLLGVRQPYALAILTACFFVVENTLIQIFSELRGFVARQAESDSQRSIFSFILANRRRFGAYVVHLAVVMMMVGFSGNAWNQKVEKTLRPGETLNIAGYTMRFDGLQERQIGQVTEVFTQIPVTKGNQAFGVLRPAVNFYPDYTNSGQESKPSYEVDVKGNLASDFYVSLSGWGNGGVDATFKVMVNYLVQWVWIGMWTLFFGTLFTLWPSRAIAAAEPDSKGKAASKA